MFKFLSSTFLRAPEGEGGAAPNQDALREALEFDMFAPPADSGSGEGEGEGPGQGAPPATAAPDQGGAEPPASGDAPPASPPPASGQANTGDDDPLAQMRAQVASLLAKTVEPPTEAPPAAPPPAPAQTERREAAGYNLTVPDEVVEAFGSEDSKVRKAAIAATVNAVANRLAQDFVQAMKVLRDDVLKEAQTQVLTQVDRRSTEEKVRSDFYGAFPALKQLVDTNPSFDQAIWQTIAQTAQRTGVKEWNSEFRDSVGAMIHLTLGVPVQASPAKPNGAKPPRKAPFSAGASPGGGGRPTNPDDNDPEGILAVINAGR